MMFSSVLIGEKFLQASDPIGINPCLGGTQIRRNNKPYNFQVYFSP